MCVCQTKDEQYADPAAALTLGVKRVRRIKVVASRLGIGRRTFYDRANRVASLAHALSRGIAQVTSSGPVRLIEEVD